MKRRLPGLLSTLVVFSLAVGCTSNLYRSAADAEQRYPTVLGAVRSLLEQRFGLTFEVSGTTHTTRPGNGGLCSFETERLTSTQEFDAATTADGQQALRDVLQPYGFSLGALTTNDSGWHTLAATDQAGVKLDIGVMSTLTSVHIQGLVTC